eukprot:TRINITY_DN20463_c0_g1::TRINITY_DN20463_c0_g1_i1::g.17::m.17 TRINITY_DN20463_c0_g1::TRINITY_DN20463_c0_g1_i1::g.17  ORF type:complete len:376 (+),score=76.33,sp/P28178/PK2_DICDI/56.33/9e-131,Pkinase/PF00069.20/6.8e-74,Pkinase_Tyr/PF07714.12/5.2e-36,Kinase-like/PF14531.1/9.5e+02,Kinase-like/PF14531.1/3.3e-05,Pkinase_C/PF00433.19/0.00011 TRINITY_DN20463_c0_g1_i1:96-1223(+)
MGNQPGKEGGSSSRNCSTSEAPASSSSNAIPDGTFDIGRCVDNKYSIEDFDLLKVVGKGSFGKVMQVRLKSTGQIYAMKILRKESVVEKKQVEHTLTERSILQKIRHPFIVELRYAFQSKDKLYFVMDFVAGGELFFHLKQEGTFSESRARFYAAQLVLALDHLHKHGIIYRDVKPENVLLEDDGYIKLTDFGLSKDRMRDDQSAHTFCGTPDYLAPEILQGGGHNKAADWWSLGTLIYEMLIGVPPFYCEDLHEMYERILKEPLKLPASLSQDAKSLLSGLLTRDVPQRLGAGENGGKDIMDHPWFKQINFQKLYDKVVPAPFMPNINDDQVNNFDPMFTAEPALDSVVEGSKLHDQTAAFAGFTYMPESRLDD